MTVISFDTFSAYQYGNALHATHCLRYKEFVDRQDYNVKVTKNGEYDGYDTPETVYLVARDAQGNILGTSRKFPTTQRYMIEDLWPELIDGALPKSSSVWESSRFCIDRTLPPVIRRQVKVELVAAGLTFGLRNNIDYFVGVMTPAIWRSVFTRTGWQVEPIGQVKKMHGEPDIVACKMPVSMAMLEAVQSKNFITDSIVVEKETNLEMDFKYANQIAA